MFVISNRQSEFKTVGKCDIIKSIEAESILDTGVRQNKNNKLKAAV